MAVHPGIEPALHVFNDQKVRYRHDRHGQIKLQGRRNKSKVSPQSCERKNRREGDHGESFFLLIAGEVDVTLSGAHLNTIRPGGCFGEILYFVDSAERRTTTITARNEVTVIEIKAKTLRAATDACQVGFNKAFMRVLIDRLTHANRRLAERG